MLNSYWYFWRLLTKACYWRDMYLLQGVDDLWHMFLKYPNLSLKLKRKFFLPELWKFKRFELRSFLSSLSKKYKLWIYLATRNSWFKRFPTIFAIPIKPRVKAKKSVSRWINVYKMRVRVYAYTWRRKVKEYKYCSRFSL